MKSTIMAILFVTLVTLVTFDIGSLAWAEEIQYVEKQPVDLSDSVSVDTVGIGAEGYSSPIQSDRIMGREIVGTRSGYIHPFLSVGGFYSDNLFNAADNEQSDWVATITPGIWFAMPAARQKLIDINTLNTAPGGLALDRFRTENQRRFQGYALYRADIFEHDRFKDENHVDHRAEGSLRVNLRGGLSMEVIDIYEVDRDPYGTGGTPSRQLDKFTSNLASFTLSYELTRKVTLEAEYGNFNLDYDDTRNSYRDRADDSYSLYAYYKYSPKTSIFLQGEYIKVDYDQSTSIDSEENNYFIGVQMDPSTKTRARLKVGLGQKDYEKSGVDDRDELLAEGQIDYFFTPKTSVYLKGYRRINESDVASAVDIEIYHAQAGYRQRFTPKLRGEAGIYYTSNDYDGYLTIGPKTDKREDDYYGFVAALGFNPMRLMNISLGYEYKDRSSNFSVYDYSSNSVFLRVTAAL